MNAITQTETRALNTAAAIPLAAADPTKNRILAPLSRLVSRPAGRTLRQPPPGARDLALGVSGPAAINIDISAVLADALPFYLLVLVWLSFRIMVMVFRSLVVPLLATA